MVRPLQHRICEAGKVHIGSRAARWPTRTCLQATPCCCRVQHTCSQGEAGTQPPTARLSPACATYSVLPIRSAHTAVVPYRLPLRRRMDRQGWQEADTYSKHSRRAMPASAHCTDCCGSRHKPTPSQTERAQGWFTNLLVYGSLHNLLVHVLEGLLQRCLHRRHIARVALRGRQRKCTKR